MPDPLALRRLDGEAALVTGASRRLGRAIAERLARAGAAVAIHYRSDEGGARDTVEAIEAAGGRAAALQADLADTDAAVALVARAAEALGDLSILVNNAAIFERTPIETARPEDFDRHMDANARSVYVLATEAGRRFRGRGGGAILNMADVAAWRPWAGYVPYSASKAAVANLTGGLARALGPTVRVNAIAPGPILPPDDREASDEDPAVRATLLGRWGAASDIAEACLFLLTTPYVTGFVLAVDGGRSIAP